MNDELWWCQRCEKSVPRHEFKVIHQVLEPREGGRAISIYTHEPRDKRVRCSRWVWQWRDFVETEEALTLSPRPAMTPSVEAIMAMMDERWERALKDRARRKAEVAVGLRFQVFQRDQFRCRYCGVRVEDGAVLHADHVMPQSRGGPTTLENLVTACVDCNLGKSDRVLDGWGATIAG